MKKVILSLMKPIIITMIWFLFIWSVIILVFNSFMWAL